VPITVLCTNFGCGGVITVEDKYAGTTMKCPKCRTSIVVPEAQLSPRKRHKVEAEAKAAERRAARSFSAQLNNLLDDRRARRFLWIGLACLASLAVFTFLPWVNASERPGDVGATAPSEIGFGRIPGTAQLAVSLAAAAYVLGTIFSNNRRTFAGGLAFAAAWAAVVVLWRLIDFAIWGAITGIGVYFSIAAAAGGAITLGGLTRDQVSKL
jgi:hypothetical protein